MRGAAELARPVSEWPLLGGLLGSASLVLLTNELAGGRLVAGYAILPYLFLGAAAGWWGYLYLNRPSRLDLWAVWFVCAALFFSYSGIVRLNAFAASTMRVGFGIQAFLLLAIGLIASRAGFLLGCRPGGVGVPPSRVCAPIQATRLPVVFLGVAAVWALRVYGASRGLVLSHSGDVMTMIGPGASTAIQLSLLGRPIILYLGAVLLMDRRPIRRGAGLLVIAGEFLFAVLWARRALLEVLIALMFAGLWFGRRLRLRDIIAYGTVVAFVTLVMWPFIFHLRTVADRAGLDRAEFGTRARMLVEQIIPDAVATFDFAASFQAGSDYLENVKERANILDPLLDIMASRHEGVPVMGGRAFLAALVAAIPRAIWPGKEQMMATETWQVKDLIEQHYRLPIIDMASSLLTHGYADAGVAGVVFYMGLLGAILGVCQRRLGASRCALLGLSVFAVAVPLAVQVEADVTDLFVTGRFLAALLLLDWLAGRWLEHWVTLAPLPAGVGRSAWAG